MFQMFKVLASLSREDNLLKKLEDRCAMLTEKLQETEQLLKQVEMQNQSVKEMAADLEKALKENKALLEKVEEGFGKCEKEIQEKLLEIKKTAEQYTADINAKVQSYESKIPSVTEKLNDLHKAVAEFQK